MIDRNKLAGIKGRLAEAIAAAESEYGVKIAWDRGSFTYTDAKLKLLIVENTSEVSGMSPHAAQARLDAERTLGRYGLSNRLDAQFRHMGRVYRIDGVVTRNKKYPIIAVSLDDGKRYKFNPESVKNGLIG